MFGERYSKIPSKVKINCERVLPTGRSNIKKSCQNHVDLCRAQTRSELFIFYATFLSPRPEELCVLTKRQISLSQKTKHLESLCCHLTSVLVKYIKCLEFHTLQELKIWGSKVCNSVVFSWYSWVKSFVNDISTF